MVVSKEIKKAMFDAVLANDIENVKIIIKQNPEVVQEQVVGSWLHTAVKKNHVELASVFVQAGLDVNVKKRDSYLTPLHVGADSNAYEAVKWLLENKADVEGKLVIKGSDEDPTPLLAAIIHGDLMMVKMLIDYGAKYDDNLDRLYDRNYSVVLKRARMWGHTDIEEYLLEKMFEPLSDEVRVQNAVEIRQHLANNFAEPMERELNPLVSSTNVLIVPPDEDCLILATSGMSCDALAVERGYEEYRYAELMMFLPPDWPIGEDVIDDRTNFWPFEWLMMLADYPHANNTWFGEIYCVVSNTDLPGLDIPDSDFCGALIMAEDGDFSKLHTSDGRLVNFYTVTPLYEEEIKLIDKKGIDKFLDRMEKQEIDRVFDLERPNVGKSKGLFGFF